MIELLTTQQMADADRRAIAGGIPSLNLMENAGAAVADRAAELLPPQGRVTVVLGRGNNGGDGYVAARLLAGRGYRVSVFALGPPQSDDAIAVARRWTGGVADAAALCGSGAIDADLIIDAMFGAGLHRPLDEAVTAVVGAINSSGLPVLAVDLPSGIDGDTGAVMGAAIEARETVTFFRRKVGHMLMPGRWHAGRLHIADIGIPSAVLSELGRLASANEPALWHSALPSLRPDAHKYQRGHAVVVSGGLVTSSAARLASRGALRVGAGLVTLVGPRDALEVNAASSLSVMVRAFSGLRQFKTLLSDRRITAIVAGPGLGIGSQANTQVRSALATAAPVVLDADALTGFAKRPAALFASISQRKAPVVLTPHDGEFVRLFSDLSPKDTVNSKLEKTRLAASKSSAVIVLKGADTVVAAPDGRAAISANAPPWLATAGAGDVLAGMIGGLLAQGMPAFEAAASGVWLHGEAANRFGRGLIAEDLPEMLPGVLQSLWNG